MRIGIILVFFLLLESCSVKNKKENSDRPITEIADSVSNDESLTELLSEPTDEPKDIETEKPKPLDPLEQYTPSSREYTSSACEKCNIDKLVMVDENIETLSYQDIYDLLCVVGKTCSNNVEFSQWSNELLYSALSHYAQAFMDILNNETIEKEYILEKISSPLLDYNYAELIKLVELTENEAAVKSEVIKALKAAKEY